MDFVTKSFIINFLQAHPLTFLIFAAQSEIQAETQAGPQHGIFIQAD
jgi:hypothetical protein